MNRIFEIFNEISTIPHGSGNMDAICDYCVKFAETNSFEYYRDEFNNVIIYVPGTAEYADSTPVILQGHLDMVCEKDDGIEFDFLTDPIQLVYDGDILAANGTTLGADNGIAVAMMFALAENKSPEFKHPPLELLLTSDEEIGLIGAAQVDASRLKGDKMINLDSEDEGVITVGCAGGVRIDSSIPIEFTDILQEAVVLELSLHGFKGGHSGIDINKRGGNASKLIGRLLSEMDDCIDYELLDICGGGKDNVISISAKATIAVNSSSVEKVKNFANCYKETIIREYIEIEDGICLDIANVDSGAFTSALSDKSKKSIIFILQQLPNGIIELNTNPIVDGELSVDTSINTAGISIADNKFRVASLIRSGKMSRKDELAKKVINLVEWIGGSVCRDGEYSSWEYLGETSLLLTAKDVYKEMYGKEAKVEIIHAGLECGMLAPKFKKFDCISIGPDLKDVHTTSERISISSVNRVYEYVIRLIKTLV